MKIIIRNQELEEHKNKVQQPTAAKIHWGRRLDKFYFSILQLFLTWDDDAASNSPTDFSSGRCRQANRRNIID